MKTKLHKITGRNRYCAPSALAAVLGIPSHDCAAYIRKATGKKSVMGIYNHQLEKTLDLIGVKYELVKTDKITFSQFVKQYDLNQLMIVNVTRHYIAISGREWCDSKSKKPQSIETYQQRKRVKCFYLIKEIPSSLPPVKQERPKFAGDKTSLDDLVRHYGSAELVEAYNCRIEDIRENEDMALSYSEAIKAAFTDLHDLYHFGCYPESGWKTINLLAHKNGVF